MNRSEPLRDIEKFVRFKSLALLGRTHVLGETEYIDISDKFVL